MIILFFVAFSWSKVSRVCLRFISHSLLILSLSENIKLNLLIENFFSNYLKNHLTVFTCLRLNFSPSILVLLSN